MIFPLFMFFAFFFAWTHLMAVSASADDAEPDGPQARPE
jgi:hypothetical protein